MRNKRTIGLFHLTFIGVCSMIGSGWLFGAWRAATIAGPWALLAWPLGAFAMLLLALCYAELGSVYPKSGGMARFAELTHGSLTGFIAGWSNWVAMVSIIPIESVSTVQYMSSWHFQWARHLFSADAGGLSTTGLLLACALILVFFFINYWSMQLFLHCVIFISIIKVMVPLATIIFLFVYLFHWHPVVTVTTPFFDGGLNSVFMAVAASGIIFSFHGFQSPINMAGEAINPQRNIPLAIIFSMVITFVLMVLLQLVFLGSVPPAMLANGWHHLLLRSPFVNLAMLAQLHVLIFLLYLDAVVSPSGTAIIYTATASRVLSGLQKNGYLPYFFSNVRHPLFDFSRPAMIINAVIAILLLFFFRTWGQLVRVVSVCIILSFITGPVCVTVMRRLLPWHPTAIKVKGIKIIAPCAFIMMTFVLNWATWPANAEIIFVIFLGLPLYFYYRYKNIYQQKNKGFVSGIWLIAYLFAVLVVSWAGSKTFGGHGWIPYHLDRVLLVVLALFFYYWGQSSGWMTPRMQALRARLRDRVIEQGHL